MTMLRQVPSRNSRSKVGFKLKNVLQVCLLIAICVWLLYQIKHSHDKKKALEEQHSGASFKVDERQSEIIRFSRKDLPDTAVIDTPHEEDKDDSEEVRCEIEHEGVITGDHDRNEEDAEHKEQVGYEEGKQGQDIGVFEGQEHRDQQEHEEAADEAREKSFKGDDPASEVVNNAQEHGVASHESKSFNGDDPSSKVVHDTQKHEEASHEAPEKSSRGHDPSSKVVHYNQEQEEASHEAREKSFRGEDESSEVVHNVQEAEHEGSHEARERSFKGDDVSSSVDHISEVEGLELGNGGTKDSGEQIYENAERKGDETENLNGTVEGSKGNDSSVVELYDTSKEANSSVVYENEILPKEIGSVNVNALKKTKPEVVHTELDKGAPKNTNAVESDNHREQQFDLKIVSVVANLTESQMNLTNTSDKQMELQSNSTDILKSQENIPLNFTTEPPDHTDLQRLLLTR